MLDRLCADRQGPAALASGLIRTFWLALVALLFLAKVTNCEHPYDISTMQSILPYAQIARNLTSDSSRFCHVLHCEYFFHNILFFPEIQHGPRMAFGLESRKCHTALRVVGYHMQRGLWPRRTHVRQALTKIPPISPLNI